MLGSLFQVDLVQGFRYGESCRFLDEKTRGCTIYEGRPKACRDYPGKTRCAYFEMVQFEREIQEDPNVIPLVQITFKR